MDPHLLAMLLEALALQQTTGDQGIGGNVPYDDYGLQDTIGGLGAADPTVYPGIGPISDLTGAPANANYGPSQVGFYGPQARLENERRLNALLAQMQQGVGNGPAQPQLSGLFGSTPTIERSDANRPTTPTPVAAPVAAPVEKPRAGTPTPDPSSDISTLPRLTPTLEEKKVRPRTAPMPGRAKVGAQQAAQAVQAVARNAVYQRPAPVYQAPAPVYNPSPVAQAVGRLVRNVASPSRSGRSLF